MFLLFNRGNIVCIFARVHSESEFYNKPKSSLSQFTSVGFLIKSLVEN